MAEHDPSTSSDAADVAADIETGIGLDSADSVAAPERIESSGSHPTRIAAFCVGAVLIALIGLLAFGGGGEKGETSRLLGERVPEISGQAMVGDDFNIDDSLGRWVLVNFFATWCPPCVSEHPELVALERWGQENDSLDVVAVVFDDSEKNVSEFFAERGGNWPVMNSPELSIDFQIRAVPETFLVNPNGIVVAHFPTVISAEGIISLIEGSR